MPLCEVVASPRLRAEYSAILAASGLAPEWKAKLYSFALRNGLQALQDAVLLIREQVGAVR